MSLSPTRLGIVVASPLMLALSACASTAIPDLVVGVAIARRAREAGGGADASGWVGLRMSGRAPRSRGAASDIGIGAVPMHTPASRRSRAPGPPCAHPGLAALERTWVERTIAGLLVAAALGVPGGAHSQPSPPPQHVQPTPSPTAGAGVEPSSASATIHDDTLARAVDARFAHEPNVVDVVQSAIEASGLDASRARNRVRRGRRSGLLPSLRVRMMRQRGIDSAAGQTTTTSTTRVGQDDALRLDATLTFDLSRLAVGPDEVAWSREERATLEAIADLMREVVQLYFRRRRLIVEIELLGEDSTESLVALAETEALLDVFTAGNFSQMMARRVEAP